MTESLRQLHASERANELTEANLKTAIKMMEALPPRYSENPVILSGLLQALSTVYAAEMGSTGHK
jgi:hypothetical protein